MELIHRTRAEDAFAVGWKQIRQGHFSVLARLPHDHGFFSPVAGGTYDPLLLVEAMRQASIMVSHAGLGVPLDHHFMLSDLELACIPRNLGVSAEDAMVEIDVSLPEVQYRAGRPVGLTCLWTMRRADRLVATGRARTRFTSPRVYSRLREGRCAPAVSVPAERLLPPESVGRGRTGDVLLAPGAGPDQWQLSVDTSHSSLFQKAKDHIPGMLLFEAARQAAHAITEPVPFTPAEANISFQRYAEFGSPFTLRAEVVREGLLPGEATEVRVTGHQDGEQVFRCALGGPRA